MGVSVGSDDGAGVDRPDADDGPGLCKVGVDVEISIPEQTEEERSQTSTLNSRS